ncbi:hypothetical protein ACPXCG_10545 [Gordonia sp. DT218]|uniref:hypothetical protein n=1 Tax=Gordonia sp. DT218 TaxID=3416659 RepID=UPI003CF0FB31
MGNAAGSPLRLSLGCLLAPTLGIELRRVGQEQDALSHGGVGAIRVDGRARLRVVDQ